MAQYPTKLNVDVTRDPLESSASLLNSYYDSRAEGQPQTVGYLQGDSSLGGGLSGGSLQDYANQLKEEQAQAKAKAQVEGTQTIDWQKGQNWAGDPNYAPWNKPHACPSCGHCPCCGRGGYQQPYYPNYPYYVPPITWTSTTPTPYYHQTIN